MELIPGSAAAGARCIPRSRDFAQHPKEVVRPSGLPTGETVPRLRCPEEACLRAPEAVVSLHVGFINAGAELIQANTFGANRRKLEQHLLADETDRINSTAVKLAREAREITGRDVLIAGSIGPVGDAVPP